MRFCFDARCSLKIREGPRCMWLTAHVGRQSDGDGRTGRRGRYQPLMRCTGVKCRWAHGQVGNGLVQDRLHCSFGVDCGGGSA
jgi:hypothetical protein